LRVFVAEAAHSGVIRPNVDEQYRAIFYGDGKPIESMTNSSTGVQRVFAHLAQLILQVNIVLCSLPLAETYMFENHNKEIIAQSAERKWRLLHVAKTLGDRVNVTGIESMCGRDAGL
jgi:hypothetical protein